MAILMKQTKRFFSLLLCAVMLAALCLPAGAQSSTARLYNVYGDHMLFQQNEDAVFAGVASSGAAVSVTLLNAAGKAVNSASGYASKSGTFSLSFPAPAGSFEAYSVVFAENKKEICTLSDVVFGELWLSFGQSNMEYPLAQTTDGRQMQTEGKTGRSGVRVLQVPHKTVNGALYADALPQTEAPGCCWFSADSADVYGVSGVAYFFAEKLMDRLNVPVGILNVAVGGSCIGAWIPRSAIESDAQILNAVKAHNAYIPLEEWDRTERSYTGDMTNLYNSKVAPLMHFRPAGGIWYQGESDIFLHNDPAYYAQLFNLMQDSYTSLFSRGNGRLPIVYTQLAAYNYGSGPYGETKFNDVFTALAAEDPASRSEVVIHDILPAYDADNHPIHPNNKKPVGERMADCAFSLLYGGSAPATSPYQTGIRVQGNSVYVTFANVGDGLVSREDELRGFSVYGADGVCVAAQAEIIAPDTVRVFSDAVPAPKGAAYAVNSVSLGANLYSSFAGERYLPAASFGSSDPAINKHFDDADWLTCDTLTAWQTGSESAGLKETWVGGNASLAVNSDRVQGQASLAINGRGSRFSASAVFYEKANGKRVPYNSLDTDFSAYGALSVSFKNAGNADITLDALRLYGKTGLFFCPLCRESGRNSVTIPADGRWHTYSFDLNELGLCGASFDRWSNEALKSVTEVRLCFSGKDAAVLCDGFRFSPENGADGMNGSLFQRVVAFFSTLFERLTSFFTGFFSR